MTSPKENTDTKGEVGPSIAEFDMFFEYSIDIMILIGFDNRIKQVSPSFERILGWKKEETISKPFSDFLHPNDIEKTKAEAKDHEIGKNAVRFENRYRCKDGSYRVISWNSHPILEKQVVIGIGRDITEHKKVEESLRQSEQRYHELFSSMTEMFQVIELIYDKDGRAVDYYYRDVNPAFERLVGKTREQLIDKRVKDIFGVVEDYWLEVYHKVAKSGEPAHFENYGAELDKWYTIYAWKPNEKQVAITFTDITQRKKAEEALMRSEEASREFASRYNALFNSDSGIAYCKLEVDENGKPVDYVFLDINEAFERQTGLTKKEVIDKKATEIMPNIRNNSLDLISIHGKVALTGKPTQFETYQQDLKRWYSVYVVSPKKMFFHSIFTDITDRKKAEDEIRENERRLNRSQEIAHLGSWELNLQNNHLTWSDEVYRIFGLKPQQFGATYEAFLKAVHPDDRVAVDAAYSISVREGKNGYEIEHRVVRPDGEVRIVHEKCDNIRDDSGKIVRSIGMVQDITERKKTEEALRLSEERFSKAFNLSPFAVILTRLDDGTYVDVNDTFLKMFEFSRNEVIGHTAVEIGIYANPTGRAAYIAAFKNGHVVDFEVDLKSKTGRPIKALGFAEIIKIGGQDLTFGTLVDITERKQYEEKLKEYQENLEKLVEERTKQLRDSERLAAIGATAGMVGHDIRNPLQAIVGDLYLLEEEVNRISDRNSKQSATETIDAINENIDYINKIVQDLQDYARPINPKIENTEIKPIIEKLLTKKSVPTNVNATVIVEDEAKKIQADSYYLNRILYNLVTNAIQAMPKGGKLTIHAFKEVNDVVITVEDTGVGIPKEIQDKLFTLMFTTKAKGQGFGLPVVKRMTESLGGTVSFEGQSGEGTTFTVRLPPPQGAKR